MAEARMTLIPATEPRVLQAGDKITSFRGVVWEFVRVSRLPEPGRQAKIIVGAPDKSRMEFYASVFPGLVVE
jgi:hypothetical protein